MKTFRLFAATAIALVAVPVLAADTGSFSPQRLSQHVQTLGSDAFEGRAPATEGETKTVDYLSKQLQEAGLQPGGDLKDGKSVVDPGRAAAALGDRGAHRTSASTSPASRWR